MRPTFMASVYNMVNGKHKQHGMGSVPDARDNRDLDYKRLTLDSKFLELPETVSLAHLLPKENWDQGSLSAGASFAANLLVSAVQTKLGVPYSRPSWMATWHWAKAHMYGLPLSHQDVGCSTREALISIKREGILLDSRFPYGPQHLTRMPDYEMRADAKHPPVLFYRIDDINEPLDIDFVLRCLAEGWPLVVSLPIYHTFETGYSDGMVPLPKARDNIEGYQALVLYGYYIKGQNPFFRARLSWGSWGGRHLTPSGRQVEGGTCRIPVDYVAEDGFDCWTARPVEMVTTQG